MQLHGHEGETGACHCYTSYTIVIQIGDHLIQWSNFRIGNHFVYIHVLLQGMGVSHKRQNTETRNDRSLTYAGLYENGERVF